jgi:hypothetical protein
MSKFNSKETVKYYIGPNCGRPLLELNKLEKTDETPTGFDQKLLRQIKESHDHTGYGLIELFDKFSYDQRKLIFIKDPQTRELVSLNALLAPFLDEEGKIPTAKISQYEREVLVSYPTELSVLRNNEGIFYRELPIEAQIIIRMAGNIITGGDVEAYADVMNTYLEIYRDNPTLAIAGMSVGGEIFETLLQRFPLWFMVRIADPKPWHGSVQNKAPYPPQEEGENKCELREKEANDLSPWTYIQGFPKGITKENLPEFLKGIGLAIDALDDTKMKIEYRKQAREMGVPLLMFTDVHPSVVVEFRDFKNNPSLPLFASISDEELEQLQAEIDQAPPERQRAMWVELAAILIGIDNIPEEFLREARAFGAGKIGILPQPTEIIRKAQAAAIEVIGQWFKKEAIPEIQVF